MRWACLSLLLACAAPSGGRHAAEIARAPGAPAAASAPAPAAPATPAIPPAAAPALPTLARSGELFMAVVTGTTARCEAWTVDPARRALISKQDARELEFRLSGKTLEFTHLTRHRGEEDFDSGSCYMRFEARETEQAIVLDGAKLFRAADACAAAVASHERVAMRFDCVDLDQAPERAQRATRARFEGMLARGGTLYSIVDGPGGDTCQAVRVRAARARNRGELEGSFEYDVVSDEGMKGITSLGYSMAAGATKITFLGPGTTWRDGSGSAFG